MIRRWVGSGGRAVDAAAGAGASSATGTGSGDGASATAGAGSGAAAFFAVFLGSSGWTSRLSPSRSALRRTRSAWASSMLDEWLLTPIPSALHRSSVSLLESPSSRANS